ncbi:MAG: DnaJ domain-containing protein [Myxococcales bacterium]|nr:DnaJ domain-containing protein [Myxococcales bacterium]
MPIDLITELIAEKLRFADQRDFYGLLGVKPDADPGAIKAAYFDLVKRFHPDRLKLVAPGADAGRVFRELSTAYTALGDPARRAAYDRERSPGGKVISGRQEPEAVIEAEFNRLMAIPVIAIGERRESLARSFLQRGATLLARGDVDGATKHMRHALLLVPGDPDGSLKLGWTLLTRGNGADPGRIEEARGLLQHAAAKLPYSADARYSLASYWRTVGQLVFYKKELEATLRCQADHPKASRELAVIVEAEAAELAQRAQEAGAQAAAQEDKTPSWLGRLFGRGP